MSLLTYFFALVAPVVVIICGLASLYSLFGFVKAIYADIRSDTARDR